MSKFYQPLTREELYGHFIEQRVSFSFEGSDAEGFVQEIYEFEDGVAFLLITNEGHRIVVPAKKIKYAIILPSKDSIIDRQQQAKEEQKVPEAVKKSAEQNNEGDYLSQADFLRKFKGKSKSQKASQEGPVDMSAIDNKNKCPKCGKHRIFMDGLKCPDCDM